MIRVQDEGEGISPEIQEKIFEPFFTTKKVGQGTGLGLSMVYGIIKNHGGSISLDSQPHQGTCFKIYLPASAMTCEISETKNEIVPLDAAPLKKYKDKTFLIIDDELSLLEWTQEILEQSEANIFSASSGKDAFEILKKENRKIDLIILDVLMPQMDGVEVYHELRRQNYHQPVIFVSGYNEKAEIVELRKKDNVSFLLKPYTQDSLLSLISFYIKEEEKKSL